MLSVPVPSLSPSATFLPASLPPQSGNPSLSPSLPLGVLPLDASIGLTPRGVLARREHSMPLAPTTVSAFKF